MRLAFTAIRPAGIFRITNRPSASVAAPSGRPTTMTFAEASVALGEKMEALSEALDESRPAG